MIDSHAHLSAFSDDEIEAVLARAKASNVTVIINISTNSDELARGLQIAQRFPWIYNVAAVPPHDVEKEEDHFNKIALAAREGKLVAIGECGLDYFWGKETKEKQKLLFRKTIALAKELHLPLVIHCRDAFSDFFQIADEEKVGPNLLIHCFSGGELEAKEAMERGWVLSFSGVITYKKNDGLREVAKTIPLDRLLIETDAPFLTPEPNRGKRNEPAYLHFTAMRIAALRNLSLDEFTRQVTLNTQSFFHLKK